MFRSRRVQSAIVGIVVLLPAALVVNWPMYGIHGPGSSAITIFPTHITNRAKSLKRSTPLARRFKSSPIWAWRITISATCTPAQGEFDIAQRYFERAMAIYPNYADVRSNYGQLIAERGDCRGRNSIFSPSDRAQSVDQPSSSQSGRRARERRPAGGSDQPLQRAVDLTPDAPEASYYLGSVYAAQNRYADAAAAFEHALQIRPEFFRHTKALRSCCCCKGTRKKRWSIIRRRGV